MTPPHTDQAKRLVVLAGALVFLVVLVRTAWIGDDAYITFRTIDNFLHGYGLRWNVDNRVQAFTHPLWLFAMSAATALTGDVYYTSILLSIGLTLVAVVLLLWRITPSAPMAVLAASVLVLSRAFIDYLLDLTNNDPLTLVVILGAAALPFMIGRGRLITAGVILYVVYIVAIGGDFRACSS
jgi:arabinofuranosyltransferase